MGQKINPLGFRLGVIRTWDSIWFAGRDYADKLLQDMKIRDLAHKSFVNAGVSKVVVERSAKKARIIIYAARPGMIIGRKGSDIEKLKAQIEKICSCEASINIQEIRKPEMEAKLVADSIAQQLEKRVAFRKALKRALQSAMKVGAKGIRITISGRLGGAEIARSEKGKAGRVPLHTLRANIDYAMSEAKTTYGKIGIKVWIYKGDVGLDNINKDVTPEVRTSYGSEIETN